MQQVLLGIALVLAVAWLIIRLRRQPEDSPSTTPAANVGDTTYHAVSIKYDESACDAARKMTGRRFLASAAPRLPLPECNSMECRCGFVHHKDRRTGEDRRSPFAAAGFGGAMGLVENERRDRRGRREEDDPDRS